MADRPILFSAPMILAILDGRKTQTRRIIKPQPDDLYEGQITHQFRISIGDRLWCRETWRCNGWAADLATIFYRASEGAGYTAMCEQYPIAGRKPIRVDGTWRPSIHMPRWASRLTLYVTEVRVERLNSISEEDARAEGVECDSDGWRDYQMPCTQCCTSPVDSYRTLWESINGKGSWADNPYVACYTFRPLLKNIDAAPAQIEEGA